MSIRQGKKLIASSTTNGFNLFDCKWADHILNNISWLRADTFSWQSGDVYKAAYEHLVEDLGEVEILYCWGVDVFTKTPTPNIDDRLYRADGTDWGSHVDYTDNDHSYIISSSGVAQLSRNESGDLQLPKEKSPQTDTIGDISIAYYQADDGHKICLPDQEANLSSLYEATGVAWYYVLDVENKQFKLPRTKFGFTGIRSGVGGYVEPGLPNIKGTFGSNGTWATSDNKLFTRASAGNESHGWDGSSSTRIQFTMDASKYNSIYGNSTTVQPSATQMYLYFYVGNYVEDLTTIDAGKLAEVVNNFDPETFRGEVNEIKTSATQEINETTQESISTLKNMGEVVNYTNITNCITEIPQDIKLEINASGQLVVKAGSKAYVPNGVGIFTEVTITADQVWTADSYNHDEVFFIKLDGTLTRQNTDMLSSGATNVMGDTTVYCHCYNTTDNKIYYTRDGGSTWEATNASLPIALVTKNNSKFVQIKQVFNGFGYIGSTLFALPGVKVLKPNWRNADGTLNNQSITWSTVKTWYNNGYTFNNFQIGINQDGRLTVGQYTYDSIYNIVIDANGTYCVCGNITGTSGRIDSIEVKTSFHAVDYNDTEYIAHQAMPSDRYVDILSMLPATNGNITAPADGYFVMHKIITSGQHLELMNTTTNLGSTAHFYSNSGNIVGCVFVPVKTGDVVQTVYNSTPTTFRFVYTNGLK